jgi:tRNA threonylcarbamoyladenosine biosynthesis protein TsaE
MRKGWMGKITYSADETISLGKSFASYLQPGDIIALKGSLAGGKTTFVKGIASEMGCVEEVTSPTFTLVNEYQCNPLIIHIDCYRESNLERWIQLGIGEYFNSESIVLIEWSEMISELLPPEVLTLKFEHLGENQRSIMLDINKESIR